MRSTSESLDLGSFYMKIVSKDVLEAWQIRKRVLNPKFSNKTFISVYWVKIWGIAN